MSDNDLPWLSMIYLLIMVIFQSYVKFIFADLLLGPHHVADALSSFWPYLVPNELNWLILLLCLKENTNPKAGRTEWT